MNIYDGCLSHSDLFYRDYSMTWDEQLDKKKKYYEDQGYKVVFVFKVNPIQDAAYAVLYDKNTPLPKSMRDFKYKYVRFNEHWYLEAQLGICDKCGEYKKLTCLCKDGQICEDCDTEDFNG